MAKRNLLYSGVVYSTDPNYEYQTNTAPEAETLVPSRQTLKVVLDKKQRAGKSVTLITGFIGKQEDLETLAKTLKTKCGVGGTAKDYEIILQGDFVLKVKDFLKAAGYKIK